MGVVCAADGLSEDMGEVGTREGAVMECVGGQKRERCSATAAWDSLIRPRHSTS